ncbi:hypothetical protein [Streptomyces viridosporus]|uniref:hypothetical protein n=1 Tax=Streptomyces viridosporus TaxID=67581 RepID=UPI001C3F837C|nr:hypothetical protein [Streptomyces viridosporus]
MDREGAGAAIRYLVRDRDAKCLALIDETLCAAGIETTPTGVRMPYMNSITERRTHPLRAEPFDRTLPSNE